MLRVQSLRKARKYRFSIEDMDDEFTVTAAMLVCLCDVVLQGELEPDALHSIGFALVVSDAFAGTVMRTTLKMLPA